MLLTVTFIENTYQVQTNNVVNRNYNTAFQINAAGVTATRAQRQNSKAVAVHKVFIF